MEKFTDDQIRIMAARIADEHRKYYYPHWPEEDRDQWSIIAAIEVAELVKDFLKQPTPPQDH